MTDNINQAQVELTTAQQAAIQAFNESVDKATARIYELNKLLMDEGISATAVALANGLQAADMTAAMAVENGGNQDSLANVMANLAVDLKVRAAAAFEHYAQTKAEMAVAEQKVA